MIQVIVKLVPHGTSDKEIILSTMEIANDATGTTLFGNYIFRIFETTLNRIPLNKREGKLSFHPRNSSVWFLVYRCLKRIFEGIEE